MINLGEQYIVVWNDNRSIAGMIVAAHSSKLQLLDDDFICHVIPWSAIREVIEYDGGPIDIVDGPDDGGPDDDEDDDPDPSGGEALPVPTSSKLIDGEIAKAA